MRNTLREHLLELQLRSLLSPQVQWSSRPVDDNARNDKMIKWSRTRILRVTSLGFLLFLLSTISSIILWNCRDSTRTRSQWSEDDKMTREVFGERWGTWERILMAAHRGSWTEEERSFLFGNESSIVCNSTWSVGWPFKCLTGSATYAFAGRGSGMKQRLLRSRHIILLDEPAESCYAGGRVIPLFPLFDGFVFNVAAFIASAASLDFAIGFGISLAKRRREMTRKGKNLCPCCGYPIVNRATGCPECGSNTS